MLLCYDLLNIYTYARHIYTMYMRTQYIDGINIFSQKNKIKKLQMAIDVNYKSFLKIKVPQFYLFIYLFWPQPRNCQ